MKSKELKIGSLLSYSGVFVNIVISLFLSPFTVRMLGQAQFGLYQLIWSFVGYMGVLDFGFSNTLIRYIAKYHSEGKQEEEQRFLGMSFIIYSAISALILIAGTLLYSNLSRIFPALSPSEILLAKKLFIIMVCNFILNIFLNVFPAVINAYERFIFIRSTALIRTLIRTGVVVAALLAGGQSADARKTVADLHRQFEERELTRFLPNMDAMLCRIALHTGDLDEADVWYRVKAPREPMHINILKRYQYFTQAMVELANGKPDSALLTLTPMEPYCTACMRYIDTIHLKVLTAIALYQKRDEAWRESLTAALALAEEYRFIRTISVYGAAVLPLLDALEWSGNAKWHKRLMADVRAQAAIYPRFLQPRLSMSEALTAAEMQVLRLICADKSNAEIGEILSIRVSTVKSHVSSVLSKLGVNRRSEARTAAKKLWLISEDQ